MNASPRDHRFARLIGVAALSLVLMCAVPVQAVYADVAPSPLTPDLKSAATYSLLASALTSAGNTVINGSVGTTTASTVEAPEVVSGPRHIGDLPAVTATSDFDAAYTKTASLVPKSTFAGDQANATFTPGVYATGAAFGLSGILTLDGGGNCGGVFIFQVNGALDTAALSSIVLTNGAQAANVFWQVNGGVSLGAHSRFVGTIMSTGAATLGDGSVVNGRVLSDKAADLTSNTITLTNEPSTCSVTPPTRSGLSTLTITAPNAERRG